MGKAKAPMVEDAMLNVLGCEEGAPRPLDFLSRCGQGQGSNDGKCSVGWFGAATGCLVICWA